MAKQLEIYGTLGPSCADREILFDMFRSGMTGIRLNLSHKSLPEFEDWLNILYEVSDRYHMIPDILVDLQGPELRIGTLPENIDLLPDSEISMDLIPLSPAVLPYLKEGQKVLLDDGKIELVISKEDPLCAKVIRGGILQSKKSIKLENINVDMPTLTQEDLYNISLFRKYRITGVMLPFVRNKEDLIALRTTLIRNNLSNIRIFAKIENMVGVKQLPSLLPHCDQIVIARGDLGNDVPLYMLPGVQKEIAYTCKRTKTPFMVVTQMLASMENSPVPTRAEVSDIFNAVLDGAASIMLTGETAAGNYPSESMKVMCDTAFEAIKFMKKPGFKYII